MRPRTSVSLMNSRLVRLFPPMRTRKPVPERKLVPRTVTSVPPDRGPEFGVTEVNVGVPDVVL